MDRALIADSHISLIWKSMVGLYFGTVSLSSVFLDVDG
jgi:hypothetical protein